MSFVNELVPLNVPDREWLNSFNLTYKNYPMEYEYINS